MKKKEIFIVSREKNVYNIRRNVFCRITIGLFWKGVLLKDAIT